MSVSVWRDEGQGRIVAEVDVAIVGGGIAGLAIARQCVRRGLVPCVIEAGEIAQGATGRNAGFAMTGLAEHYDALVAERGRDRARAIWQVSQANLRELVDEVVAQEGVACDLVPCGSVLGAWTPVERDRLDRSYAMLREDGFDVDRLDAAQLEQHTGSSRFLGGLFVRADHGVHPAKLAHGLAARITAAGGSVRTGHEVRALDDENGRVRVSTSKGDVLADRVVLATNAYSRLLDPWFATRVRPVRGQVLATAPLPLTLRALLYTDDGFQYARQLPDGRMVIGGWRRDFAQDEVGYADEPSASVQGGIEGFAREAWPSLAGTMKVTHRWSGVMGFSPDALPLVGVLPHRKRVAFAVGFTGHGLGFSLAAARAVMDVLSGTGDGGLFAASRLDAIH